MEPEFPPNNARSRKPPEEKDIPRVVKGGVSRKKKSLRKQFSETFVAGDARGATRFVIFDVLLPDAKNLLVDMVSQGFERLIFGDSRRRGSTPPQSGATGYVNYGRIGHQMANRYSSGPQRTMSRQARSKHNFDEIVLDDRTEAEEVIDRLFDVVSRHEFASVADLYELVGLVSTHIDHKWGWSDLTGAGVTRMRGGYLLDLPEPEPLD